MSTVSVGVGQSIQAAIDAASPGDTIDVQAGSYNDQFLTIEQSITLQAVGGEVVMTEDTSPPNGKAMIDEGGAGVSVTINGFDISGVSVPDGNGAAIRYEGGALSLSNVYFHDNQEGLLGAPDANGSITVDHSEFSHNGDGSGSTHNIYVGQIASFTLTNSYFHDAVVGHEVKSRAANNTITNNRIFDNNGSASYSIDLPNGGNATISGNVIEQGANTQNPNIIAYGEEGASNPGSDVSIANNTIVNDDARGSFLLDSPGTPVSFTGNSVFGLTAGQLPASSDTVLLASRPSLDTSSLTFINPDGGSGDDGDSTGGTGDGTGGAGGTGGGDAGGTGGTGTGDTPPPPALTLDQYHQMVVADFSTYAAAHPEVWSSQTALSAIITEITSTTVLTMPVAGDLWS